MQLPFASYQRHVPGNSQRLVNILAEQKPLAGKAPLGLIRAPGVRAHKDMLTPGGGRGLSLHQGKLHAVAGTKLYRVPLEGAGGSVVSLGTIPGTRRVTMASNRTSLGIVTNPDMYALTAGVVTQITDADFTARGAVDIGMLDGYFTHVEPASDRHFSSDLYALTYDALKFATAELTPDDLVGHIVNLRQATFFGKKTTEIWYNSGATPYPLEKVSGGDIMLGSLGGHALADNREWWLASDKTVRVIDGQIGKRESQHGVEEWLQANSLVNAYGFTYTMEGHVCYVLQIPEVGTWVKDITTGEWHERASTGQNDWRVCDAIEIDGVTYVQDGATGKVGILDPATFDEWGQTLRPEWTYPNVYDNGQLFFHNHFELMINTGVGLASGQGSDPEVMLEFSDDGGMTWLFAENRTMGKIGKYKWRVMWHELGASEDRVYRCSVSDPVQVVVSDTRLAAEPGDQ